MNIISIQNFPGRNIHCHRPVMKAVLDLGDLYDTPTKDIRGFNERLAEILPGIERHFCSCGYEGGFQDRLKEGTYPAHVTEHIILELQTLAGYKVSYGKSRVSYEPSIYNIIFEYENEKSALECLLAAVEIFNALTSGITPDIKAILDRIMKISTETDLGPSTRAIFDEAAKRGIPAMRLGNESLLQLGYGKYSRRLQASLTDAPGCIAVDIAGNKQLTKEMLELNGIAVPEGSIAYSGEALAACIEQIGYPVVIKPYDANQGKGVTLNIQNMQEAEAAYNEAKKFSKAVIVEEFITGSDYRLLVIGGKLAAAAERIPPNVTGDGKRTVRELVDEENRNELRGIDHEKPLTKISLDETSLKVLTKSGIDIDYIPAEGERIYLRFNGNLSTGGTARDCTEEVHPLNAEIAVKAAEILGLDIAGVDITAEDISKPISVNGGAIIEVNAAPGLRMHLYPSEGKKRDVAKDIVEMLFPKGKPCSIPVVSVTGTNGKTTTTRLIAHTISAAGKITGMTSTSGVYIGGKCILKGDNTGPASARTVLSDKNVEAAVLETARGGIIKRGLGYDMADVGVIVNISEDHMGLDGVNSLEELAFVKSLVVEAVKPGGYAVLNADDQMTPFFMKRINCRLILFSSDHRNKLIRHQIGRGGKAVYCKQGSIYIFDGNTEYKVADVNEIPITFNGQAACNIENSLAAVSALHTLNMLPAVIREGLISFKPDISCNPGRMNIFDLGDYKIMLDYGHNPAGFRAVTGLLAGMEAKRYVGIIGMPGDRNDSSIREAGAICSRLFSRIYIKEDKDLRGRNAGEVADIFYDAVIRESHGKCRTDIIYSELEALNTAIDDACKGDLIVVFCEDYEALTVRVQELMQEKAEAENPDILIPAGSSAG